MQVSSRSTAMPVGRSMPLRSVSRVGGARLLQQPARYARVAACAQLRVCATAASTSNVRMIIQGRKLEVTDAIKNFVEDKVSKAVHAFDSQIKEIDVKLSVRGGDAGKGAREHRVELTVYTIRNGVVRAENAEDNLYAAVDVVCDKVQRNLRKLKEKAVSKGRWPGRGGAKGGQVITEVLDPVDTVSELPINEGTKLPPEVVRSKYFYLEPLSVEDAVEKLQMVGHTFYIFREKETKTIQVVYERKSGGYGVIVPMGDTGADLFPSDPSLIPSDA